MLNRKYPILCLLFVLLFPVSGFSQFFYYYANPLAFGSQITRYTAGDNLVLPQGEYNGLVPLYDKNGNQIGDTVVKKNVSGIGIGVAVGVTLPIARTGRRSSYGVSIDLHYNNYVFTDVDQGTSSSGQTVTDFFHVGTNTYTTQIAMPISVDLKYGSDAIAKRTSKFGLSLGAGISPQYQSTYYSNYSTIYDDLPVKTHTSFGVTPFVKAELSAYFIFCFRVKVFYSIGGAKLFEEKGISTSSGQMVTNSLTTKSQLTISFCTLPFSFLWLKERRSHGWWDNYEAEEAMWRKN